jgi:hypothetical protein
LRVRHGSAWGVEIGRLQSEASQKKRKRQYLKKKKKTKLGIVVYTWLWQFTPVIQAPGEGENRRTLILGQPKQKCETLSEK